MLTALAIWYACAAAVVAYTIRYRPDEADMIMVGVAFLAGPLLVAVILAAWAYGTVSRFWREG